MNSFINIFISGAPLSAAKGIGPRLPRLIHILCSLFFVLPLLHGPLHHYVGPTIDSNVKSPETKSCIRILTLPPAPSKALRVPVIALPIPPSPSKLETTSCVLLVIAGVAAVAGVAVAVTGGGAGKRPDRRGTSPSRRKKEKRAHKTPRGPTNDGGDGGPPDDDSPPPPPPSGNGQGDKLPGPPNVIDLRLLALLLALYFALAATFWRVFPDEFRQLIRNAKNLLEKARFNLNDREFQRKLSKSLRGWLRQARATPMAPAISEPIAPQVQDVVVARAIEMEQVLDSQEWWAPVIVTMIAGVTVRLITHALAQLIITAPNVVGPIINPPNAIKEVEEPVTEDDTESLSIDDGDLAVIDAEEVAMASGLGDEKSEGGLQALEAELGGQEDCDVAVEVEVTEPSKVEEPFLRLPDAGPVVAEAVIGRDDEDVRGIETDSESEKQPNPIDLTGGGRDENLGLEETQIVPEAVGEAEKNKATAFDVPGDLNTDREHLGGDGDCDLGEVDFEAVVCQGEGAAQEEGLERSDSTPVEGALPVVVDDEERETESPDEVRRKKLNAEGKRPELATQVVLSASMDSCTFDPESPLSPSPGNFGTRKAKIEADAAYARKIAEDEDSLDAQYQLTQSDSDPGYSIASSSRLPDISPPPFVSNAEHSWLSDSKVQEVIERQHANSDCDHWRPHPESQETTNGHAQERGFATQKEEAVDTVIDNEPFRSQAKNSRPEDLVVATEEEDSFFPSTPAPRRKFNPSAPPFFPSAKKTPTPITLRSLPFWAPNTTPAAVIKAPPTAAEKKAAKMARRLARRAAASLLADDTSGNGSSLEISPFTVGAGLAGSPIHVGSLFRSETVQVQAVAAAHDAIEGTRFKEKGISEAHTTPRSTSAQLNPTAIPFFPPTRPVRVEHDGPAFWSPLRRNPIAIVTPPNKKERRRLRALALQGSISSDV